MNNFFAVVKRAKFDDQTKRARSDEAERLANDDLPTVFNRRHFSRPVAGHDTVFLTTEARTILSREEGPQKHLFKHNGRFQKNNTYQIVRNVVEGLKTIHRDIVTVKECLCHVISYERYGQYEYITKRPDEDVTPCYFIVRGLVEVTYESGKTLSGALSAFEKNIIYSHGPGEYLGLVSHRGREFDYEVPNSIYTKEPCELLRIGRNMFHDVMKSMQDTLSREIISFLSTQTKVLYYLDENERSVLAKSFMKQKYLPKQVIIQQDAASEWLYIICQGCCKLVRHHQTEGALMYFDLGSLWPGDVMGMESLLQGLPNTCSVVSCDKVVCYKIHKSDVQSLNLDRLQEILNLYERDLPSDDTLSKMARDHLAWEQRRSNELMSVLGLTKGVSIPMLKVSKARLHTKEKETREKLFKFLLTNGSSHNTSDNPRKNKAITLGGDVADSPTDVVTKRTVRFRTSSRPKLQKRENASRNSIGSFTEANHNDKETNSIGILEDISIEHEQAASKFAFNKFRTEVLRRKLHKARENQGDGAMTRHRLKEQELRTKSTKKSTESDARQEEGQKHLIRDSEAMNRQKALLRQNARSNLVVANNVKLLKRQQSRRNLLLDVVMKSTTDENSCGRSSRKGSLAIVHEVDGGMDIRRLERVHVDKKIAYSR